MKNRIVKWAFIGVCVAGALFALVKVAFFEYPRISRLKEDCRKEEAAVIRLQKERDRLAREVHDINTDPVVVEKYARKEGWIREGETVILIPEKARDGKQP